MSTPFLKSLTERAAAPYRAAGQFAWRFARGKLGGDPVFAALLEHGLIPSNARILDIGCGQGLLASWLLSARTMHDGGDWPAHWPAAPNPPSIHGIELSASDVERAQKALGHAATFTNGDMCKTDFRKADVIVILDVLHYAGTDAQNDVLQRARDALAPGGTLLLRVGDADGGLPFKYSVWVDHVVSFARGHRNRRFHCRTLAEWCAALTNLGFAVSTLPMSEGTLFANVLLVAKLGQNSNPASHESSV
jgi:SAM-dependent methyltransferase